MGILAGLFGGAIILHTALPDQMLLSWALFEPVMILSLYLLMLLAPLLDPWRRNYARFDGVYRLLRWLMVLFMSGVCAISRAEALGYDVGAVLLLDVGTALLFILIGNVIGQIRPNFFVGIRVPWTLADGEVWRRTHRLAARVWVLGGLVCLALAPVQASWSPHAFVACLIVMGLVPVVYSYAIFRRLRN